MGTEFIKDPNCKHTWIKRKYEGYGTIATWNFCPKCKSEKNRKVNVDRDRVKEIEAKIKRMAGF